MKTHISTGKERFSILHLNQLNSTNAFMQNELQKGESISNNVVRVDYQTEGKGLDTNKWDSDFGQNLLFSMAIDLGFLEAEQQFKLTQAVSVGIINVLERRLTPGLDVSQSTTPKSLSIKWPNDIYFSDKKLAGILISNTLNGKMMGVSIIGIGLNVNQIKFRDEIPNPISMKMISGSCFDLEALLLDLLDSISESVELLKTEKGKECLEQSYIRHLYRFSIEAPYELKGERMMLTIIGFDSYGRLQLQDKYGKTITCDLKEIKFL